MRLKFKNGFTLIEMLVVLTIVSILVAVLSANFIQADRQKNDAKRKADLTNLQNAIELYKNKYGKYPAGCKGAGQWSGEAGSDVACSGGSNDYIVGLAPEFIPTLPVDPSLNGADSGYRYVTNSDGSVYKMVAKNTVESETVDDISTFRSCDRISTMCLANINSNNSCAYNDDSLQEPLFEKSFGLWGGYAATDILTKVIMCKKL